MRPRLVTCCRNHKHIPPLFGQVYEIVGTWPMRGQHWWKGGSRCRRLGLSCPTLFSASESPSWQSRTDAGSKRIEQSGHLGFFWIWIQFFVAARKRANPASTMPTGLVEAGNEPSPLTVYKTAGKLVLTPCSGCVVAGPGDNPTHSSQSNRFVVYK